MNNLLFNPEVRVTPQQLVQTAEAYLGLPYCRNSSWIEWDYHHFVPSGRLSCFGLFLQVAKDLRLLDDSFDINLSPENFGGRSKAHILREILETNFDRWPRIEPGCVLLMRFSDLIGVEGSPHHVGLAADGGCYIHACGLTAGDTGAVVKQRLDELTSRRVAEIWKLRNLEEGK